MTATPLPAYADARKVFAQEAELAGSVAIERLPRFRENLAEGEAEIAARLDFRKDNSGQQIISGELEARVPVQCQRCLEPVEIALREPVKLALVQTEAQAKALPAELDPWLSEDFRLDLARLVEEQLLLALPIVSYHPEASCKPADFHQEDPEAEPEEAPRPNPFAILESLKKSDEDN